MRAVEEDQPGLMPQAQRFFLLTQIDNLWKEHLQAMEFLRKAVGLRGFAPPAFTYVFLRFLCFYEKGMTYAHAHAAVSLLLG